MQAARRVGGEWTAPVLDADTEAEVPWVATGYVAGPSLQAVVAKEYGPLPERSVRVLASRARRTPWRTSTRPAWCTATSNRPM